MSEAVKIIFQSVTHIMRELQIYCLSGFLIILNIWLLDFSYYHDAIFYSVSDTPYFTLLIIITSYILGNISMGVFVCIMHKKEANYRFFNPPPPDEKLLHVLYNINPQVYKYFLERYSVLIEMRFNMSAAFSINFLINATVMFFNFHNPNDQWQIIASLILYPVFAFSLYKLSIVTEGDYKSKINSIISEPPQKNG